MFFRTCACLVGVSATSGPMMGATTDASLEFSNADLLVSDKGENEIAMLSAMARRSFFQDSDPEPEMDENGEPTYPWDLSFELGGSGSRGNTDEDNLTTAIRARRETPKTVTDLGADYRYSQTNDTETKNQTFLFGRREWNLGDSPWTVFATTSFEFDEFKEFDTRWALAGGFGYRLISRENEKLQLVLGPGFSKEFGSQDDDYKPEALFGLLYRNQLNDSVVLTAAAEYYPNLEDWVDDYRIRSEAALEVALTEGKDWWLKLSVQDNYDNTPSATDEANDFYYGVSLLLKF
ncbi:MAG: YdiY family protein [Phycisphaerales bacterium JB043]